MSLLIIAFSVYSEGKLKGSIFYKGNNKTTELDTVDNTNVEV